MNNVRVPKAGVEFSARPNLQRDRTHESTSGGAYAAALRIRARMMSANVATAASDAAVHGCP
jgi:hypothetical protein